MRAFQLDICVIRDSKIVLFDIDFANALLSYMTHEDNTSGSIGETFWYSLFCNALKIFLPRFSSVSES